MPGAAISLTNGTPSAIGYVRCRMRRSFILIKEETDLTKYIVSKYKDRGDAGRLAVGRIAGGVGIAVNVVLLQPSLHSVL